MNRPYTIIFSTMTADGRIADPSGYSRLSCREDFKLLHKHRAWADAVMVGSNTVLIDNPQLTVRLVKGKDPYRVVVDSRLRIPLEYRIFSVPGKAILITTENHSESEIKPYQEKGIHVIQSGIGKVDLVKAMEKLYDMGIRKLLVEGGGTLNCILLKNKLVDEIHVTVSPFIFGSGISLFDDREGKGCKAGLSLNSYTVLCGGWMNLEYRVVYD